MNEHDLARRVEAAIAQVPRTGGRNPTELPRSLLDLPEETAPRGGTRPTIALVIGLVLLHALRLGTHAEPPAAHADPAEVRARIEQAQAHRGRHPSLEIVALDDAARRATRRSPERVRALRLRAAALRRSERIHAATAAELAAAATSLPGERARDSAPLAAARLLEREGDLAAAEGLYAEVAERGRRAGRSAVTALERWIRLRFEQGDRRAVEDGVERLAGLDTPADVLIEALGRQGELALDDDDARTAKRALSRARRLYAEAEDDPRAARAWLDLPLRARLGR